MCERLNAYWLERGFNPEARPVRLPFRKEMRAAYFTVQSKLVNGRPPARPAARPTYRPEAGR